MQKKDWKTPDIRKMRIYRRKEKWSFSMYIGAKLSKMEISISFKLQSARNIKERLKNQIIICLKLNLEINREIDKRK